MRFGQAMVLVHDAVAGGGQKPRAVGRAAVPRVRVEGEGGPGGVPFRCVPPGTSYT